MDGVVLSYTPFLTKFTFQRNETYAALLLTTTQIELSEPDETQCYYIFTYMYNLAKHCHSGIVGVCFL